MKNTIGIVIGTGKSSISVCKDNKIDIIPNNEGYIMTPSVISYIQDDDVVVGSQAKRQLLIRPDTTYSLLDYYIHNGLNIKEILIQKLIEDAKSYLDKDIDEIVLSVPCLDSIDEYKQLEERLCIKIRKIINHLDALALTYQKEHNDELVMIVQIDEAFTHIGIYDVEKDSIERLANTISDLKGYDFTQCIADYLSQSFYNEHKIDLSLDSIAIKRIIEESKKTKKELSVTQSSRVLIPYIHVNKFGPINLDYTITRTQFNNQSKEYIDKLENLLYTTLNKARLLPGEIDKILLVGGSSRIPVIQDKVKEILGQSPSYVFNNIESIAIGCAMMIGEHIDIKNSELD